MASTYDLVVIGTGVAGKRVAFACREAGWSVAIIDQRDFGGTCALRGCDPKKVLVHASHVVDAAKRLEDSGVNADTIGIQWADLMTFKSTFVQDIPSDTESELLDAGIDTHHGSARFSSPNSVIVDEQELVFDRAVIATGAVPRDLEIPGEDLVSYSDDLLDWPALPKKIVFIGGGYISFEFAHLTARAGAKVTILERNDRVLSPFDADLTERLKSATEDLGVDVRTGVNVSEITQDKEGLAVHVEAGLSLNADAVVHGAGRVPAIQELNLEAGEIASDGFELSLNDQLQSASNPRVYAVGDAAPRNAPLTPVANRAASALVDVLLENKKSVIYYDGVPSVVFTTPRIAAVGMTEERVQEERISYTVSEEDVQDWFSARHRGLERAYFKVIAREKDGALLGAHLLYPEAEEIINLFSMAIQQEMTVDEFRDVFFAYPSSASDTAAMLP